MKLAARKVHLRTQRKLGGFSIEIFVGCCQGQYIMLRIARRHGKLQQPPSSNRLDMGVVVYYTVKTNLRRNKLCIWSCVAFCS